MLKLKRMARPLLQVLFLGVLFFGLYGNIALFLKLLLPAALVAGNFFCGWVCPMGAFQDLFSRLGLLFIKKKLRMPWGVQKYLQFTRYLVTLIAIALGYIGINTIYQEATQQVDSYHFFLGSFSLAGLGTLTFSVSLAITILFAVISVVFDRPYCNYLCREGLSFSLAGVARFFTIKRNEKLCIGCKKCDAVCPMNIQISQSRKQRNQLCIHCFNCIHTCPVPRVLTYGYRFRKEGGKISSENE